MNFIYFISFISGERFLLFKFGDYNKANIVVFINQTLKEEYDIYLSSSNKTKHSEIFLRETDKQNLINKMKNELVPIHTDIEYYTAYIARSPINLTLFTDNFILFSPQNSSLSNIIRKVDITEQLIFSEYEEIGLNSENSQAGDCEKVMNIYIKDTKEIICTSQLYQPRNKMI